ncbi:MAG: diguanylate cyclase [Acidobacteriota bacterium]
MTNEARLLRLLSSLNQARRIMLRAPEGDVLARQVCAALASAGRHRYAWVGVTGGESGEPPRLLGSAGSATGGTSERLGRLELDDPEGPSRTAIDAGQPCVLEHIRSSTPWSTDASLLGLSWAAAFPMGGGGNVSGVLTILSAADDGLDSDQLELVHELARDLGVALAGQPALPVAAPVTVEERDTMAGLEQRIEQRTQEMQELNRQLRLELVERKKAEDALRQRFEVERAISAMSARLVVPERFGEAVDVSLSEIGELSGASRASLALLHGEPAELTVLHEWCAEGVERRSEGTRSAPIQSLPWLAARLGAHDPIQITDVADLPGEAAAERRLFESHESKSLLIFPVHAGEEMAGFLAIEDVVSAGAWRDEDVTLLRLAAQNIGNSLLRQRASEAMARANAQLQKWVDELETHNRQIRELSELSSLLQSCQRVEESHAIIAKSAHHLLAPESGGVFLFSHSRNIVEAVAVWGDSPPADRVFAPDACWALRRGRTHHVRDGRVDLLCQHLGQAPPPSYVCVPMMAQGEALGLLYLQAEPGGGGGPLSEAKLRLAATVADHLALAIANLKLRETLHGQSIRDPLTSLFNRRYMVESLDRDLRRAARNGDSVGVMMLDLDHFKRFNDTHGHDAGDQLLRELGALLLQLFRGEDVACRYGGEEFTVILPEASPEDTRRRAEQLRESVKGLRIQHLGQTLEAVSVSIGVAVFPNHASTGNELLAAADAALYRAKSAGRNCVIVAAEAP